MRIPYYDDFVNSFLLYLCRCFCFKLKKELGAGFEPARFLRKVLPITPTELPLLNTEWDGTTSVLAVDSAVDDSKYVGVWCRKNTDGDIVASVEFQTESIAEMWERITQALEREPKTQLAITPSLFIHTPEKYQRRTVQWGYGEINKYTSTVKGLINEDRVKHTGEVLLSEHVNRAVLIRGQGGALSISSQRSPGPIEACRCLIAATVMVSRPTSSGRVAFGVSA